MDKEQCLHSFWASFGLPAYDERTVPESVEMPYITYEVSTSGIGDSLSLSASLWYRSTGWGDITKKGHEINENIGYGGSVLPYDGGALWITRGTPFSIRMSEPNDNTIRRLRLSVNVEFLSED